MKRRTFLKTVPLGAAAGLNITSFPGLAQTDPNRYWIFAHCHRGWDTTLLCDPKGDIDETGKGPVNKYPVSFIRNAGNINYVPSARPPANESNPDDPWAFADVNQFFTREFSHLLVVNGIKMGTISHPIGAQLASGGHIRPNQPHFCALYAAAKTQQAGEVPLPFGYYGNYSEVGNLIPRVPVSAFEEALSIANPTGYMDFDAKTSNDKSVFNQRIEERIRQQQEARLARQFNTSNLLKRRELIQKLQTSREQSLRLGLLKNNLPSDLAPKYSETSKIQHVLASMKAGLTYGAHFEFDGVDSHSDNDPRQYSHVNNYFKSINVLLEQAESMGIRDKLNIVLTSDFSRTPYYNDDKDGKDHWPVTSMMFLGPDFQGNRVVGGTTDSLEAKKINYDTLNFDDKGKELEIRDIHLALRQTANIDKLSMSTDWPLENRDLETGYAEAPKNIFSN